MHRFPLLYVSALTPSFAHIALSLFVLGTLCLFYAKTLQLWQISGEPSLPEKVRPCSRPAQPESELTGDCPPNWGHLHVPLGQDQLLTGASGTFATNFTAQHNPGRLVERREHRNPQHLFQAKSLAQSRDLSVFSQLQDFTLSSWRKGVCEAVSSQNCFAKFPFCNCLTFFRAALGFFACVFPSIRNSSTPAQTDLPNPPIKPQAFLHQVSILGSYHVTLSMLLWAQATTKQLLLGAKPCATHPPPSFIAVAL